MPSESVTADRSRLSTIVLDPPAIRSARLLAVAEYNDARVRSALAAWREELGAVPMLDRNGNAAEPSGKSRRAMGGYRVPTIRLPGPA
jgi:hypothetical protein